MTERKPAARTTKKTTSAPGPVASGLDDDDNNSKDWRLIILDARNKEPAVGDKLPNMRVNKQTLTAGMGNIGAQPHSSFGSELSLQVTTRLHTDMAEDNTADFLELLPQLKVCPY